MEDHYTSTVDGAAAFERWRAGRELDDRDPPDREDPRECPDCGGSGGGEGYWRCPYCGGTGAEEVRT